MQNIPTQTLTGTSFQQQQRIMVIGGTGFLGFRVIAALLESGAEVTVLTRPDQADKLQGMQSHVNLVKADVWNKASLRGRARGHSVIIHLIGSTRADPARGLTYQQVNLVAARHVTSMAVSDGVPAMILLSAVSRPELSGDYIYSKREAEHYLRKSGLQWTIVRAPALYQPDQRLTHWLTLPGKLFPLNLLFGNYIPLSVDRAARGMAHIALNPREFAGRMVYANQLRRLSREKNRQRPLISPLQASQQEDDPEGLDEPPFGWLPPGY